jgi:hypothetical protein
MDAVIKKRGGPGRGQGRKPLGCAPSVVVQVRMTPAQRDKLAQLGGADWVRQQIDAVSVNTSSTLENKISPPSKAENAD